MQIAYSNTQAENRSLQLKINHVELQVSCLLNRDAELQKIVTDLHQSLALAEQDKLILETKLREVSTFQQYQGL